MLITCAAPSPASAQLFDTTMILQPKEVEEEQAAKIREFMRAGLAEYRKKNLEGARQAFVQAWETAHRADVAAALADVEMKLGRYRDAAEHWDYYLQSERADHAEAAARLDECRAHVALVRVELDPPGAQLEVDGARRPTGIRGGNIWLEPGTHAILARDEGRASWPQTVEVSAGQTLDVRLAVEQPAVASLGATPTPTASTVPRPLLPPVRRDTSRSGVRPRTLVLIGGTTLTVAGTALGVWSLIQRSNADRNREQALHELHEQFPESIGKNNFCSPRPDLPPKCLEIFAKSDEANRQGNWAIGGFVAAGAFGVATALTYAVWPSTEKQAGGRALVVAPLAERGARGVQLRMAF
jgi:hypothetical protein